MENSLLMAVSIFFVAILMFVFPLISIADQKDNITTQIVQNEVTKLVKNVRQTGILTQEEYNSFFSGLTQTGYSYDIQMKVQILDKNSSQKKISQTGTQGENLYYTIYSTQILNLLNNQNIVLKDGDIFTVNVENKSATIAQQLRNYLYVVTGNNTRTINASDSGIVTLNGN